MRPDTNRPASLWKVIAGAGLVVGTLDIADAFIFYDLRGVSPVKILQGIASRLLGRTAFVRGLQSAFLGIALHLFIAFVAVTVYLLASHRLPLSRHPFFSGAIYGVAFYCVMNYVVLPLSNVFPKPRFALLPFIN